MPVSRSRRSSLSAAGSPGGDAVEAARQPGLVEGVHHRRPTAWSLSSRSPDATCLATSRVVSPFSRTPRGSRNRRVAGAGARRSDPVAVIGSVRGRLPWPRSLSSIVPPIPSAGEFRRSSSPVASAEPNATDPETATGSDPALTPAPASPVTSPAVSGCARAIPLSDRISSPRNRSGRSARPNIYWRKTPGARAADTAGRRRPQSLGGRGSRRTRPGPARRTSPPTPTRPTPGTRPRDEPVRALPTDRRRRSRGRLRRLHRRGIPAALRPRYPPGRRIPR